MNMQVDAFGYPMVPLNARSLGHSGRRRLPGVSDLPYLTNTKVNGVLTVLPAKRVWDHMIDRCYSRRVLDKFSTYADCTVCDEWLSLSAFADWMALQPWKARELDEDFLVPGNRVYGPETCLFVPTRINSMNLRGCWKPGGLPLGVSQEGTGFIARVRCGDGTRERIGHFQTVEEAAAAYRARKSEIITEVAADYAGEPLLHSALLMWAERTANEHDG